MAFECVDDAAHCAITQNIFVVLLLLEKKETEMYASTTKKIIAALIMCTIAMGVYQSGIAKEFTIDTIKTYRDSLTEYVALHQSRSILLFLSVYILAVITLLPVVIVLSIMSGFLFGVIPGTIYAVTSATIGGTIAFLIVRYFFVDNVIERHLEHFKFLKAATNVYGAQALLIIRLLPFIPFFLINLLTPFLRISTFTFAWTTAIGITPETIMYAWAGSHLLHINSAAEILTPKFIAFFILLSLIALSSIFLQKNRSAITQKLQTLS